MDSLEKTVRLVIEKSWAVGVLLAVAGGLAWFVDAREVPVPALVHEWAPITFVIGIAFVAVSAVYALAAAIKKADRLRRNDKKNGAIAEKNLRTLTVEERDALLALLEADQEHFEIGRSDISYVLYQKKILEFVDNVSRDYLICKINSRILRLKEKLMSGDATVSSQGQKRKVPVWR